MVNTISKAELSTYAQEVFPGRIIVIQEETEAKKACDYLSKCEAIGFDTETRPAFRKGVTHQIALMQLSTIDTCFLFRLNLIGSLAPANFVELQSFVKDYGIEDNGLQRIYGILFEKRISKGQRLSNWEVDVLSDSQKMYAALDAWACLRIYNELKNKEKINSVGS